MFGFVKNNVGQGGWGLIQENVQFTWLKILDTPIMILYMVLHMKTKCGNFIYLFLLLLFYAPNWNEGDVGEKQNQNVLFH